MTQDLIPADVYNDLPSTNFSDESFEEVATSTDFLQRLQLLSKGKYVDARPKQAEGGDYAVIIDSEKCKSLGNTVDLLVFERRHKALDMSDLAHVLVSYDPQSDLYKDISARSTEQDSGCQYGVEFLIGERSTAKLYGFFFGTKSLRRALQDMYGYMPVTVDDIRRRKLEDTEPHGPLPVTLTSKPVRSRNGKFSWFVPEFQDCSTPFTRNQLPPAEKIREELIKFRTPDKQETAVVKEERKGRAR
jgi:hypothetical protein